MLLVCSHWAIPNIKGKIANANITALYEWVQEDTSSWNKNAEIICRYDKKIDISVTDLSVFMWLILEFQGLFETGTLNVTIINSYVIKRYIFVFVN